MHENESSQILSNSGRKVSKMSTHSVIIRPVRPEDASDLQANCFSRNTLKEVQQQIERLLAAAARGQSLRLVAEVDGTVVGNADLIRETHRLKQHRADWGGVVVSGPYQGRGIARMLLQETLAQAATWGIELLTVGVRGGTPAEEIYRHLGFREYARLPNGFKEAGDGTLLVFDDVMLYMPVPAMRISPSPSK